MELLANYSTFIHLRSDFSIPMEALIASHREHGPFINKRCYFSTRFTKKYSCFRSIRLSQAISIPPLRVLIAPMRISFHFVFIKYLNNIGLASLTCDTHKMPILDDVIGNVIQKELHCLDIIVINGIIKWIPLSSKDTSFGNEKSDVVFCTRVCPSLKQRSGNMKAARGHRNM